MIEGYELLYENIYPYTLDSRYKTSLEECPLYNFYIDHIKSCSLSQLPLIAQRGSTNLQNELILSRLLVSQKWIGG